MTFNGMINNYNINSSYKKGQKLSIFIFQVAILKWTALPGHIIKLNCHLCMICKVFFGGGGGAVEMLFFPFFLCSRWC